LFLILIMIYYPGGVSQLYETLFGKSKNPVVRWLINKPETAAKKTDILASPKAEKSPSASGVPL